MDPLSIIGAVAGIVGAGTGVASVVITQREKRRHVAVKISTGLPVYGGRLGSAQVLITVTNPGYRTVTLTGGAGIILPNGKEHTILNLGSNVTFPHELAEGESCLLWVDSSELAHQLKNQMGLSGTIGLRAFVDSALGTRYRSKKKWKFDIDGWIKRLK